MSPELLKRYYRDECTPAEKKQVEDWLNSPDSEPVFIGEHHLNGVEDRMWTQIVTSTSLKAGESGKPFTYYLLRASAAVIALLVGATWVLNNNYGRQQLDSTIELSSDRVRNLQVGQLSVLLAENSKATFMPSVGNLDGDITFCGALRIINNSQTEQHFVFESACKKTPYTRKRVTIKPGKTYVALHNYLITDEVMVISKERLQEFPDALSSAVRSEFSI